MVPGAPRAVAGRADDSPSPPSAGWPTPTDREAAPPIERQLADGRWLQVNELKTRDGGTVSVGSDITQIKQHQEKLVDSERRLMATIHDLSLARRAEEERTRELVDLNRKYMKETSAPRPPTGPSPNSSPTCRMSCARRSTPSSASPN